MFLTSGKYYIPADYFTYLPFCHKQCSLHRLQKANHIRVLLASRQKFLTWEKPSPPCGRTLTLRNKVVLLITSSPALSTTWRFLGTPPEDSSVNECEDQLCLKPHLLMKACFKFLTCSNQTLVVRNLCIIIQLDFVSSHIHVNHLKQMEWWIMSNRGLKYSEKVKWTNWPFCQ